MAADVGIYRHTGASGAITKNRIDSGSGSGSDRMSTSDVYNPGTNNPIPVPAAGTNYSYWVSTRLSVVSGITGTINNLKWYTDGAGWPTGFTCSGAKASTGADAGYRQATGTLGTSGTLLNQTNHTGLDAAPSSIFGYTSGSPLSLTGSTTGTGDFGDFVVYQLAVASTASPQTLTAETITWQYDET